MEFTLKSLKNSQLFSEELGIALKLRNDAEYFKWFLASLLFGGRISETIAKHTYRAFAEHGLLTPARILDAGWDFLVNPIMREGGYVRYDGRKSTQILKDCETLRDEYGGSLNELHRLARDRGDLETRVKAFYGVGPVTANIFLRELRPYWSKADPEPLAVVKDLAERLGLNLDGYNRRTVTLTRIEAGLLRLRHSKRPENDAD
jgi:hypothetical protein